MILGRVHNDIDCLAMLDGESFDPLAGNVSEAIWLNRLECRVCPVVFQAGDRVRVEEQEEPLIWKHRNFQERVNDADGLCADPSLASIDQANILTGEQFLMGHNRSDGYVNGVTLFVFVDQPAHFGLGSHRGSSWFVVTEILIVIVGVVIFIRVVTLQRFVGLAFLLELVPFFQRHFEVVGWVVFGSAHVGSFRSKHLPLWAIFLIQSNADKLQRIMIASFTFFQSTESRSDDSIASRYVMATSRRLNTGSAISRSSVPSQSPSSIVSPSRSVIYSPSFLVVPLAEFRSDVHSLPSAFVPIFRLDCLAVRTDDVSVELFHVFAVANVVFVDPVGGIFFR